MEILQDLQEWIWKDLSICPSTLHNLFLYYFAFPTQYILAHTTSMCCAPLLKECPYHQVHKEDPVMTLGTYVMFGEGIQVDLILGMGPRASRTPPTHGD
jgi:hypothetical protein